MWWPDDILHMETTPTIAAFNSSPEYREDGLYSIYLTTFIIAILLVGMVLLNFDARMLSNLMNEPIALLHDDMALVSNMLLRSPIEHKPSKVTEIRNIQMSFIKMKYGLSSFAKYVPYEVVRGMMSKGEEAVLGVNPKEVTIFFSDIAGFTSICESMQPNKLLALLSDYFAAMSAIIQTHRGTLLEFIGDALLVIWNAPQSVKDHAYQCVEAALKMNEYLEYKQPEWTTMGYPSLKIRSGIHTATVFVGNIGSPERMKYGVLGDGVNLASRLEELNKRYKSKVMISILTERKPKVQEYFLTRPLDFVAVKGKTKGTAVFEVLGRRNQVSEDVTRLAQLQTEAMDCYYVRDFDTAAEKFREVGVIYKKVNDDTADAASELLRQRCMKMSSSPPADDWNRCEVLHKKHF